MQKFVKRSRYIIQILFSRLYTACTFHDVFVLRLPLIALYFAKLGCSSNAPLLRSVYSLYVSASVNAPTKTGIN